MDNNKQPEKYKYFPLYFADKPDGLLRVPNELTEADYELLKTQVAFHLETVKDTSIIEAAQADSG